MKKIIVAALLLGTLSSCLKDRTGNFTCSYNECAFVAPAAEIQQVKDYLTANNINATQHCSGLFYTIDDPGTGANPTVCNNISFTYQGKLTNGNTFDESTSPIVLSLSSLITGFKNGIPLIKTGGRMHLYVPPSLGYGSQSSPRIPANSILIFDVTLVGIQ